MKSKCVVLLVVLAVLCSLGGCASFLPNTAEVLEPHGFEDFAIAVGADIEMLVELIGAYGWLGLLML